MVFYVLLLMLMVVYYMMMIDFSSFCILFLFYFICYFENDVEVSLMFFVVMFNL